MKIYLSPSNQNENTYSAGGTNEMEQCSRVAEAAEKYLLANGFLVKRAPKGQKMQTSILESNAWGADLHICLHTNAGGGKGCEVYVKEKTDSRLQYAQPIYDAVAALTPSSDRGIKTAGFAEIKQTTATCVYCELEFHDNATRAQWIIDHVDDLGRAVAQGICKAVGKSFVEPGVDPTPEPTPAPAPTPAETLYRVRKTWTDAASQIGAFAVLENAKNACKPGYTVYDENGKAVYAAAQETVHTVKAGDTLWGIADKYLGDGTRYTEIKTANGLKSDTIYSGQKLTIPGTTPGKSLDDLALEVYRGDWGNGQERIDRLTAAGYDAAAVQNRVNTLYG